MGVLRLGGMGGMGDLWSRGMPAYQLREIPEDSFNAETISEMTRLAQEASVDPRLAVLAKRIVSGAPSKGYVEELRRVYNWVKGNISYRQDPRLVETLHHPIYMLQNPRDGFDCFVKGTLVLRRDHQLVPIEDLVIGDEIWGYDRWSKVVNTWDKPSLPTSAICLNNGSSMRLTKNHKIWRAVCDRHKGSKPCSCQVKDRTLERVAVEELQPGDVLLQPERVPYGTEFYEPDLAYLEGVYASDGWHDKALKSFFISGQDGCPKESQKAEVQRIAEKYGFSYTWKRKSIQIFNADFTRSRIALMGPYAPGKRINSLAWNEAATKELLRGVLADSGQNTSGGLTFTSTSYDLAVQTRVMLKMAGVSCSTRYVPNHGGLGLNPVYRLGIRVMDRPDGKSVKLLRVKEVKHDNKEFPCFDIATDDHMVWLPETDVTTSQCDDHSMLVAALCMALGHGAAFRTVCAERSAPNEPSHVYPLGLINQHGSVLAVPMDTTMQSKGFGWEPRAPQAWNHKTHVVVMP